MAAKRLYFDVIPRNVDEYYQFLDGFERQDSRQQLSNPVWHIHSGKPPKADMPIAFNMLLTLVSSSNAENAETLWGFIGRYRPGVTPKTHPKLNELVEYAIHYFRDFVLPEKRFREPTDAERAALIDLRDALSQLKPEASAEEIQNVVYEVGRREPFLDITRLVQPDLSSVAGSGKRSAFRFVRRALRSAEHRRYDRWRLGAIRLTDRTTGSPRRYARAKRYQRSAVSGRDVQS